MYNNQGALIPPPGLDDMQHTWGSDTSSDTFVDMQHYVKQGNFKPIQSNHGKPSGSPGNLTGPPPPPGFVKYKHAMQGQQSPPPLPSPLEASGPMFLGNNVPDRMLEEKGSFTGSSFAGSAYTPEHKGSFTGSSFTGSAYTPQHKGSFSSFTEFNDNESEYSSYVPRKSRFRKYFSRGKTRANRKQPNYPGEESNIYSGQTPKDSRAAPPALPHRNKKKQNKKKPPPIPKRNNPDPPWKNVKLKTTGLRNESFGSCSTTSEITGGKSSFADGESIAEGRSVAGSVASDQTGSVYSKARKNLKPAKDKKERKPKTSESAKPSNNDKRRTLNKATEWIQKKVSPKQHKNKRRYVYKKAQRDMFYLLVKELHIPPADVEVYLRAFAKEKIDNNAFLLLTDEDLKDLGVVMGHRKKILKGRPKAWK